MSSVNKVIIVGRLGKDPETRYMKNGSAVSSISVATSDQWTDKASGEKKEATEWHRIVFYDRLAEVAGEYLTKGSLVYVEGKLKTRKYEQEGVERFVTEVIAHTLQMLGGGSRDRAEQPQERQPDRQPDRQQQRPQGNPQRARAPSRDFNDDDDIPF